MSPVRLLRNVARLSLPVVLVAVLAAACAGAVSDTTTTTIAVTTSVAPQTKAAAGPGETTTTTTAQTTTSSSTTTTVPEADPLEIVIEDGEVVGGPQTLEVALGDTAHFVVVADVEDHVHVHGYDLFFDVAPGIETEVMFTADIPGIFEVELEGSHMLLLELEVS